MTTKTNAGPVLRADGSCPVCSSGWVCAYHQEAGLRRDRERSAVLRRVCESMRAAEIGRVCARFELESDEFQTREQKAGRIIAGGGA